MRFAMRASLLLILLAAPVLAGCLTDAPDDLDAPEPDAPDPLQLASGNAVLYLHHDGGSLWMAPSKEGGDELVQGSHAVGAEPVHHRFGLRPAPASELQLEGTIEATFTTRMGTVVGQTPELHARLLVDGAVVGEGHHPGVSGSLTMEAPERIPAGADVSLEVCLCPQTGSVVYEYELRTDGGSRLVMPVVSPSHGPADGEPRRSDGAVTTQQRPDGTWVARRTVSIDGDLASGTRAQVVLSTANGGIDAVAAGDGYQVVARLEGRGGSEEEARRNLDGLTVDHQDRTEDVRTLRTQVKAADWQDKQASLEARYDAPDLRRLDASTTNGGVSATGFTGDTVELGTTNGGVACSDLAVRSLRAVTTNGGIDCQAVADDVDAQATNAGIDLDLEARASGSWTAATTNGGVHLKTPEDGSRGHDVTGHATNGRVEFRFQETEPVGDQSDRHRHERTQGFEDRDIQTVVDLSATNGGVTAEP